jgi:hypothetical protein
MCLCWVLSSSTSTYQVKFSWVLVFSRVLYATLWTRSGGWSWIRASPCPGPIFRGQIRDKLLGEVRTQKSSPAKRKWNWGSRRGPLQCKDTEAKTNMACAADPDVLVYFLLLKQITWGWELCKENRFIWLTGLKAASPRLDCPTCLAKGPQLHHIMAHRITAETHGEEKDIMKTRIFRGQICIFITTHC